MITAVSMKFLHQSDCFPQFLTLRPNSIATVFQDFDWIAIPFHFVGHGEHESVELFGALS